MRTRCGAICGLMLLVTGPTTRAAAASGETPLDALAAPTGSWLDDPFGLDESV